MEFRKKRVVVVIHLLLIVLPLLTTCGFVYAEKEKKQKGVTYDSRSLIIDGNRELLFSGSIHYPRLPPEMWVDIINKAKEGGLNLIQTYVFWNIHEPVQGQFNFEGNYDLVKFIKLIGEEGLYVTLRVGPYIEAEWNAGGFPYWLREIKNITFRTYNQPFMYHMQRFTEMIINKMKDEKLFAPQGGPIILAQIENEYNNIQLAYKQLGKQYIEWAANMAVSLYNGVPWVMCKQKDAPPSVISTCNGRHCGDTWTGSNGPNKPSLWTENWTAQYRVFGDPPSQRAAEDIAFSVAHFFSKNGTHNNYYMYYGGTNFGRSSSSFVTTRYYDEAPLDEFGLRREPKFGHLRDLHRALRLAKRPLLWGTPREQVINNLKRIVTYEQDSNTCAAFLINQDTEDDTMNFRGVDYLVPFKSISILPDCKTVVYNTNTVVTQHNARNFHESSKVGEIKWEYFTENVPTKNHLPIKSKKPLELYSLTKDTSDYAWYSTRIHLNRNDLPMKSAIQPVLTVASLGHALLAFVNDEYVGFHHGSNVRKDFVMQKPVTLKTGVNDITFLAMTTGFPNSGAYMERRFAGPEAVTLQGLMAGTLDITLSTWGHQVGVFGEHQEIYTEEGSKKQQWQSLSAENQKGFNSPVTWYKTYFDEPEGNSPVAIRMNQMSKGMIWVNGKNIGRYWVSYLSPLGEPTQIEYHIPRSYLKPKQNLLVVLEEIGGDPRGMKFMTVNRDTICIILRESHLPLPDVDAWERIGNQVKARVQNLTNTARLTCPDEKVVKAISFASFGNNEGACGELKPGDCNAPNTLKVVQQLCMGKNECEIPVDRDTFLGQSKDGCPDIAKVLAVEARCGHPDKSSLQNAK